MTFQDLTDRIYPRDAQSRRFGVGVVAVADGARVMLGDTAFYATDRAAA